MGLRFEQDSFITAQIGYHCTLELIMFTWPLTKSLERDRFIIISTFNPESQ